MSSKEILVAGTCQRMSDVSLHGLQILVIDDDLDSRDMLVFALESEGATVVAVASVREAVQVLKSQPIGIVLSDLTLPDEDGYALIRYLHTLELPHAQTLPAIAVTACAGEGVRQQVLASGFQSYVVKPIDLDQLFVEVSRWARRTIQS